MRIFFICQRVPFPPDRGDKITTFHEIKHLSRHHEVHVFCTAESNDDIANVAALKPFTNAITVGQLTSWGARIRALRAIFGSGSLSVAAYRIKSLHSAIRNKFRELSPDLIIVFSSNMAQYAEKLAGTPKIVQFAELDSAKWGQYAAN